MIRILIVDDQNLVREGIKILLEKADGISIVGEAKNGTEALQQIRTLKPNVVLLDIEMPDVNGLTVADKIRSQFPQIKVIMLSSHEDNSYVEQATSHGAKGYLLKNVSSEELEWSVRLVDSGYSAIKSELLEQQLETPIKSNHNLAPLKNQSQNHQPFVVKAVGANDSATVSTVSLTEPNSFNQLERLLVDNQLKVQSIDYNKRIKKKKKKLLHGVRLLKFKRTLSSFEFRLLVLIILFSLGFLTFVALS